MLIGNLPFLLFVLLLVSTTSAFAQYNENFTTTTISTSTISINSTPIDFSGHYRMTVGDRANFRALLAELGIGYFKRMAASAARYSYIISQNQTEGTYCLQTINSFRSPPGVIFRSGVSFADPAPYDPTTRSTIIVAGNRWTHLQKGRLTLNTERTFNGNPPKSIDVITKCNGVTVTRKYERV